MEGGHLRWFVMLTSKRLIWCCVQYFDCLDLVYHRLYSVYLQQKNETLTQQRQTPKPSRARPQSRVWFFPKSSVSSFSYENPQTSVVGLFVCRRTNHQSILKLLGQYGPFSFFTNTYIHSSNVCSSRFRIFCLSIFVSTCSKQYYSTAFSSSWSQTSMPHSQKMYGFWIF